MNFKKNIKRWFSNPDELRREDIFNKFREYTMIPKGDYIANLVLAEGMSSISGCIVECGVWKGGMIAGIASILGPHRKYYLFDSFEGLPPAKDIDGPGASEWQSNTNSPQYYDNCTASQETAYGVMKLADVSNFELVAGWFNETLPTCVLDEPIALLRLDGDWYDSTMDCLENLFDKVNPGGIILIDDYHMWDGCSRAVHDFLSRRSAAERIDCYNGVCFIRKKKVPQNSTN